MIRFSRYELKRILWVFGPFIICILFGIYYLLFSIEETYAIDEILQIKNDTIVNQADSYRDIPNVLQYIPKEAPIITFTRSRQVRHPSFWLRGTQKSHYSAYYAALYVEHGMKNDKVHYTSASAQIYWGTLTYDGIEHYAWVVCSRDLPVMRFISLDDTKTPNTAKNWMYLRNHKTAGSSSAYEEAHLQFQSLDDGGALAKIWMAVILIDSDEWKVLFEEYRKIINRKQPYMEFKFIYLKSDNHHFRKSPNHINFEAIKAEYPNATIFSFQTQHDLIFYNNLFDDTRFLSNVFSGNGTIFCIKRPCEEVDEEEPCADIPQKRMNVITSVGPISCDSDKYNPMALTSTSTLNNTKTAKRLWFRPSYTRVERMEDFLTTVDNFVPYGSLYQEIPDVFNKVRPKLFYGPALIHWPENFCHYLNGAGTYLLIIKSAHKNRARREIIRKIVAAEANFLENTRLEPLFLFGYNTDDPNNDLVREEIELYDDIIIADFQDSYFNLTLKTLAMFRFFNSDQFLTRCHNLKWAITQDDDVYIKYNVFENRLRDNYTHDIYCFMATNKFEEQKRWIRAFRSEKNPLDEIDYPLGYMFPPWCHGGGVGISRKAMSTLYSVAVHTWRERFKIDDLLFFGVYPNLTGMPIADLPFYSLQHYQVPDEISKSLTMIKYVS